jgi:hypothetical protein
MMTSDDPSLPCLVVVGPERLAGLVLPLSPPEVVIGHSDTADVVLEDEFVSRRHALVTVDEAGVVTLIDLNSTAGTFVNDVLIDRPCVLQAGDLVRFADLVARFEPGISSAAAVAAQDAPTTILPPSSSTEKMPAGDAPATPQPSFSTPPPTAVGRRPTADHPPEANVIYPNEAGVPSLVVADGETVIIGAREAAALQIPVVRVRPLTTAALLVLGGRPPSAPPRLSDDAHFERIESTEGLVNLSDVDEEGTIAGYSIPFLCNVLDALDPRAPVPPPFVEFQVPHDYLDKDCGCNPSPGSMKIQRITGALAADQPSRLAADQSGRQEALLRVGARVYVPDIFAKLGIYSLFVDLGDIIVGFNSTLVLNSDLSFASAHNVFAYRGSRIVQRSNYLVLDVGDTMRGGIQFKVHSVTDRILAVDRHLLAEQMATKP